MRILLLALGAAATALASPVLAQGRGHGQGHGQGQGQGHGRGHGNDGDQLGGERGHGGGRGGGHGRDFAPRGGGGHARADHARRGPQHAQRQEAPGRGRDRAGGGRGRHGAAAVVADRGAIVRLTSGRRVGLINGCPPGLARKHNGCLPPGQARRLLMERPWYGSWWHSPGDGLYRYDGGYLYRLRPDGMVAGFVPLAGGALWLGNRWPATYAYDPLPPYYVDYYRYRDPYAYRYADGIVYGLDPETETIRQIAALATGDDWGIGRPMPLGYSVYNVPYAYRDRYNDGPDDWYRYSDGYVYRVDPTTQLVEAAIRLIA
jgi:hypothetical protein